MSLIDISTSVFASAKTIAVETQAATQSTWRQHAVQRIVALSKGVAITATLTLALPAAAEPVAEASRTSSVSAAALKASSTKGHEPTKLNQVYADAFSKTTNLQTWESLRPGLTLRLVVDGKNAIDSRSLEDMLGLETVATEKPTTSLTERGLRSLQADAMLKENPIGAKSFPKAFFSAQEQPSGSLCHVHVNAHVSEAHRSFKEATGMNDDVVADLLLRHELSHCIGIHDMGIKLIETISGQSNPDSRPVPAIVSRLLEQHDFESRAAKSQDPRESLQRKILSFSAGEATPLIFLQDENFADALALLTLLKESRITLRDMERVANFRADRGEGDRTHDTSDLLFAIVDRLKGNSDLVKQWQSQHEKNQKEGKPLEVKDLDAWLVPLWIEYENEKQKANEKVSLPKPVKLSGGFDSSSLSPRDGPGDLLRTLSKNATSSSVASWTAKPSSSTRS